MRTKSIAIVMTLLAITLLWPGGVWARRATVGGSLTITKDGGPLSTELVVMSVTSNPGLEKTIAQQLPLPGPLFVLPFFVSQDKDNPGNGDLDTILTLTNTTAANLGLTLTLRRLDGSVVTTSALPVLSPHETRVVPLSSVLP